MLRKWGSAGVIAAMLVSGTGTAFAAGNIPNQQTQKQSVLAPGMPAGVHEAQTFTDQKTMLWLVGAGFVIGGIALVLSGNRNGSPTQTPCAPDGTCPPPPPPPTTTTSTPVTATTTH